MNIFKTLLTLLFPQLSSVNLLGIQESASLFTNSYLLLDTTLVMVGELLFTLSSIK